MTEKYLSDEDLLYLDENYKRIKEDIAEAAVKSGRTPDEVRLMAVTKTVMPVCINHIIGLGADLIGENKVQELLEKKEFLNTEGLEIHIIGHLQSNKVRKIIGEVGMIQSVDSLSLAEEISKRAVGNGSNMKILLEVNIGSEESKTGLSYEEAMERAFEFSELPGLDVRGFMAIPPVCDTSSQVRKYFEKMNELYLDAKNKLSGKAVIDTLSLGMSSDYREAVLEGSTLVRVGSALFGKRHY